MLREILSPESVGSQYTLNTTPAASSSVQWLNQRFWLESYGLGLTDYDTETQNYGLWVFLRYFRVCIENVDLSFRCVQNSSHAEQRLTRESYGRQSYHQDDHHEKENWNDDVDDVEERFAIQINSELDARIVGTEVRAEAAMTMNVRSDHLPYIYNSRIT